MNENVKFCSRCGHQNSADALFCSKCGSALTPPGQPALPPQPPLPPLHPPPPPNAGAPKKTGNYNGCLGCLTLIVAIVIFGSVASYCSGGNHDAAQSGTDVQSTSADSANDNSSDNSASQDQPTPVPRPTATPESYEHQQKREKQTLLTQIDHSITAEKISGNPTKYQGDAVELNCTVANVVQQGIFNALCGDDGFTAIVVEYDDTNSLDKGQSVRILGTVEEPSQGTNAFGGAMNFPTVKAEFME